MGSIVQKAMGPLMTAAGIAAAIIPGGQAFAAPLITGGVTQMSSQGGVLGPSQPNITPPATPNYSMAPMGPPATPDIPTSAASGISTFVPGAGAGSSTGVAPTGDTSAYASMIASNMMTNNPFAMYAGS